MVARGPTGAQQRACVAIIAIGVNLGGGGGLQRIGGGDCIGGMNLNCAATHVRYIPMALHRGEPEPSGN